jgi:hypothetical protein
MLTSCEHIRPKLDHIVIEGRIRIQRHPVFLAGTRLISTPRLNTLLYFHLVPINLIISQGT